MGQKVKRSWFSAKLTPCGQAQTCLESGKKLYSNARKRHLSNGVAASCFVSLSFVLLMSAFIAAADLSALEPAAHDEVVSVPDVRGLFWAPKNVRLVVNAIRAEVEHHIGGPTAWRPAEKESLDYGMEDAVTNAFFLADRKLGARRATRDNLKAINRFASKTAARRYVVERADFLKWDDYVKHGPGPDDMPIELPKFDTAKMDAREAKRAPWGIHHRVNAFQAHVLGGKPIEDWKDVFHMKFTDVRHTMGSDEDRIELKPGWGFMGSRARRDLRGMFEPGGEALAVDTLRREGGRRVVNPLLPWK